MQRLGVMAALALLPFALPRSAAAQTPVHFSVVGGLSAPVGDLGKASDVGLDIGLRVEGSAAKEWGLRGDLSWDRFGGKGIVNSYSYLGIAGNIVHRDARLYEFGGLGYYNQRVSLKTASGDSDNSNIGLQLGLGVNFESTFLEFGITNVFTSGSSSSWFPVRIGYRF